MRKYAVLVLLIPLFLLSCKKNNLSATTSAPNSDEQLKIEAASPAMQQIFQNVKALHSQQLKKLAFRLLSAKEKYLIWADNIQTVSANFNPAQTALAAE